MTFDEWKKGGTRYLKLKMIVPAYLKPAEPHGFFVAVRKSWRARLLIYPLAPLRREYVIAATTEGVVVLKLRRPGVFSSSISSLVYEESADRAVVSWDGRTLTVNGEAYLPIPFHRDDAERVADSVSR